MGDQVYHNWIVNTIKVNHRIENNQIFLLKMSQAILGVVTTVTAVSVVTAIIISASILIDINNFSDEISQDLVQFRGHYDDAWRTMMVNEGMRGLVARKARQAGYATGAAAEQQCSELENLIIHIHFPL